MRSAVLIGGIPAVASSGALCGLAPGLLSACSLFSLWESVILSILRDFML